LLTLGPHSSRVVEGPLAFQSIEYAMDFTPEAAKAATYALAFAQDSGARLYLCYVRSRRDAEFDGAKSGGRSLRVIAQAFDSRVSLRLESPGMCGEAWGCSRGILDLAERKQADLIVLGAREARILL
jgi:nucleotide-binding universal stress UspA family protein